MLRFFFILHNVDFLYKLKAILHWYISSKNNRFFPQGFHQYISLIYSKTVHRHHRLLCESCLALPRLLSSFRSGHTLFQSKIKLFSVFMIQAIKRLFDLSKAIHNLKKCFIYYNTTQIKRRKANFRERSFLFRKRCYRMILIIGMISSFMMNDLKEKKTKVQK